MLTYPDGASSCKCLQIASEATSDAEDLTQDTFCRALVNIDRFQDRNFIGWLYRIARNRAIDHYRKQRKPPPLDISEIESEEEAIAKVPDTAQPSPDATAECNELFTFIDEQLDEIFIQNQKTEENKRLGVIKKRAFRSFVFYELKIKEVRDAVMPMAQEWGISLPSTFFDNWKRDILEPLLEHIIEEHSTWIQDIIGDQILGTLLKAPEHTIIQLHWGEGKTIEQMANEMGISAQCILHLSEQAKEKVKKVLFKHFPEFLQARTHAKNANSLNHWKV